MAIVPLKEWSTPTFTVSAAFMGNAARHASNADMINFRVIFIRNTELRSFVWLGLEEIADARADDDAVLFAVESACVGRGVVTNFRLDADVRHRLVVQRQSDAGEIAVRIGRK